MTTADHMAALPGTVDDRMKIAASLGEAMTAVAKWDVLDEGDRDELLGPWATLAA